MVWTRSLSQTGFACVELQVLQTRSSILVHKGGEQLHSKPRSLLNIGRQRQHRVVLMSLILMGEISRFLGEHFVLQGVLVSAQNTCGRGIKPRGIILLFIATSCLRIGLCNHLFVCTNSLGLQRRSDEAAQALSKSTNLSQNQVTTLAIQRPSKAVC